MENRLLKFKKYFLEGNWHVHTSYTDGENTVREYCENAIKNGTPLIAFTEHVRRNLNYDFDEFLEDIKKARKDYPELVILAGCEAKVLDLNGNLDASRDVLEKCDIVLGAFHSFPYNDKKNYLTALKNMLMKKEIDVWAHPTLFARKNNFRLSDEEIREIIKICKKNGVIIEKSLRYGLPDKRFTEIAKENGNLFIVGEDAHSI